jgi:hypothetical protein
MTSHSDLAPGAKDVGFTDPARQFSRFLRANARCWLAIQQGMEGHRSDLDAIERNRAVPVWPFPIDWLQHLSGQKRLAPRKPGGKGFSLLEPASGRYVPEEA